MKSIKSTNSTLELDDGCTLAIIDKNGNVINQGDDLKKEVFDAMTEQVIEQFCNRFTGFTKYDFKNVA